MNILGVNEFTQAIIENQVLKVRIDPFKYQNGHSRLPRKNSKSYDMIKDIESCFKKIFDSIPNEAFEEGKFKVCIIVHNGTLDRLGRADLDNYSKAILDGITFTKKVWNDDRHVDELVVKRVYADGITSFISMEVSQI